MAIKVINPGLATTVQDLGRKGYFHLGIPMSGAMDQFACRCANLLVGNDESLAVLEAVFIAPQLEFLQDCIIAITGGQMVAKLDSVEQPSWTSIIVKAGQKLTFTHLTEGARIYIAISGGIDVPVVLGSRSTYSIGALGGYYGRALKADDLLPIGKCTEHTNFPLKSIPKELQRTQVNELRVVTGLYWHRITEQSGKQFFADTWQVASEADRMGYRFKGGTKMDFVEREQPFGAGSDPSNIVDACYAYGSIQVPSGKEPIILHRDAVSGGGYFMIGTVISADMDLIAQMQPHTKVKFKKVSLEESLQARKLCKQRIQKIRDFLSI